MRVAFMLCKQTTHPCGGAAICMRMFRERTGEFGIYPPEAYLASVFPCGCCSGETGGLDAIAEVLDKEEISHIHLAACTSICPAGNYDLLKQYWQSRNMTIGEYVNQDSA